MRKEVLRSLAPTGRLRAAINLSNFLLVPKVLTDGTPVGTSPDLAFRIAEELGIECELVLFDRPGSLADKVNSDVWDIGNIARETARAKTIDFTSPYVLIDAHFMVRKNSEVRELKDVDSVGTTIAVVERSAYDLWLTENLNQATLVRAKSMEEAGSLFGNDQVSILAGLKPALLGQVANNSDYTILYPRFTAIEQAVGIRKGNPQALVFLDELIKELVSNGFIESSLKAHNVHKKLSIPSDQ